MKQRKNNSSWFLPNYIAATIDDVNFTELKRRGIKACFYDLDHTLLFHGTLEVDKKVIERLKTSELDVYIATNRKNSPDLAIIAKQINAKGIIHAGTGNSAKPTKKYYNQAIELTGLRPSQLAMIGDRIMQDVWGAHRSGLYTILVGKFGPIKWWDQPISLLDRLIPVIFARNYRDIQ